MHPPVAGLPASLELVVLQGRVVRPSRFRLSGHLPAGACRTPDSAGNGVVSSEAASAGDKGRSPPQRSELLFCCLRQPARTSP